MVDLLAHVIEQSGGGVALDMARSIGSNDVIELYLFPGLNTTLCTGFFSFGWMLFHMQQNAPLEFLAYTALMRDLLFPRIHIDSGKESNSPSMI